MSQHCTLAVIGFDSEVTKEIKKLVNKSYLDLRIEYLLVVRAERAPFESKLQEDFDIIILNSKGFSTPLDYVIQNIKSQLPLAEIVLIAFEEDYHLALNVFRAGARDILNYPLKEADFLMALERSQSYRSLYQKSQSISDILTLIHQFGDIKRFKSSFDLMSKFDDFVTNKFQGDPFLIVSYSTVDVDGNPLSGKVGKNFRTLWNKRLYGVNYKKDEISEVLDLCDRNEFESGLKPFIEIFHKGSYYYFMSLGLYDNSQYISLFKIDKDRKNDYVTKIIGHLSRLVQNSYYQLLMAKEKEDLKVLIHNDDVTGLYNQRKLHIDLDFLIEQFENQGHPFSIVFIDIDHFKSVNDGHGHLVGSQLLVEVADILRACLRDTDLIYRYGGDEFVVIIPETAVDEATQVGGRILKEIKGHRFRPGAKDDLNLSVSLGVAEFPGDAKTKEEVLQIADDMMYKAKNAGRGRVVSTRELLADVKDEEVKKTTSKAKIVNGN